METPENPLNKIVFIQRVVKFAASNPRKAIRFNYVNHNFRSTLLDFNIFFIIMRPMLEFPRDVVRRHNLHFSDEDNEMLSSATFENRHEAYNAAKQNRSVRVALTRIAQIYDPEMRESYNRVRRMFRFCFEKAGDILFVERIVELLVYVRDEHPKSSLLNFLMSQLILGFVTDNHNECDDSRQFLELAAKNKILKEEAFFCLFEKWPIAVPQQSRNFFVEEIEGRTFETICPLIYAAASVGNTEVMRFLENHNDFKKVLEERQKFTPLSNSCLEIAAKNGHVEVFKYFLYPRPSSSEAERGINDDGDDDDDKTKPNSMNWYHNTYRGEKHAAFIRNSSSKYNDYIIPAVKRDDVNLFRFFVEDGVTRICSDPFENYPTLTNNNNDSTGAIVAFPVKSASQDRANGVAHRSTSLVHLCFEYGAVKIISFLIDFALRQAREGKLKKSILAVIQPLHQSCKAKFYEKSMIHILLKVGTVEYSPNARATLESRYNQWKREMKQKQIIPSAILTFDEFISNEICIPIADKLLSVVDDKSMEKEMKIIFGGVMTSRSEFFETKNIWGFTARELIWNDNMNQNRNCKNNILEERTSFIQKFFSC